MHRLGLIQSARGICHKDIIADLDGRLVPFEVKYRAPQHTGVGELKGMVDFCAQHKMETGYGITREMTDFQVMDVDCDGTKAHVLKIPAPSFAPD